MKKIIVSDLDGTLLSNDKSISQGNLNAIAKAEAQGVEFMIATGREYRSVKDILVNHNLKADAILMNGAQYRNAQGSVVSTTPLSTQVWQHIYRLLEQYDTGAIFNFTHRSYAVAGKDDLRERIKRRFGHILDPEMKKLTEKISEEYFKHFSQLRNLDELAEVPEDVLKIEVFDFKNNGFEALLGELQQLGNLAIVAYGQHSLEITNQQAQKGITLEQVLAAKGYTNEDAMVIGDSRNDISMFERFSCSVAMGNADEDVAATANHRTKTNKEDGVAHAIEMFCLDKSISA